MAHGRLEFRAGARGVAIAGPTASGKSALALDLAQRIGGWIINADSMQIYRDLRILTARPTVADEATVPHRLYGSVDGAEAWSAARWARAAVREIEAARKAGAVPILVGGTGLFFKSLFNGLSDIPEIPPQVRTRWRATGEDASAPELHRLLAERDPVMAARLRPTDTQRIVRALEVFDATGRSLADWQASPGIPLEQPEGWMLIKLTPAREDVTGRADARVDQMIADGALDEVRLLLDRGLPSDRPVMKAIGVGPLADVISGRMDLETARERIRRATRQYIKRQDTWFRGQMPDWEPLTP